VDVYALTCLSIAVDSLYPFGKALPIKESCSFSSLFAKRYNGLRMLGHWSKRSFVLPSKTDCLHKLENLFRRSIAIWGSFERHTFLVHRLNYNRDPKAARPSEFLSSFLLWKAASVAQFSTVSISRQYFYALSFFRLYYFYFPNIGRFDGKSYYVR